METQHQHPSHKAHDNSMYRKLILMALLSFMAMYVLMYSMVDRFSNVVPNINQFYMATLMTLPMMIIELLVMDSMYLRKKLNMLIIAAGVVAMIISYLCIRQQAGVGDKQFLKSMVPHHAAAILMVEKASLSDPEIKKLADDIIAAQQREIEQMKAKIEELEKQ